MQPTVAIIGAGPGGLAAARYLSAHGFACTIFEQAAQLGGQWNAKSEFSGVWPTMRTNTSRVMTSFSDMPHEPGAATYPTNQEIFAYLGRYAERFDLTRDLRTSTRVEAVEKDGTGYLVRSRSSNAAPVTEHFDRVIIASGRYNHPSVPHVAGLETFTGSGGITHTLRYKNPEKYRGLRVLVAGSAISALEIASDLVMLGAERVVSTYRRQRYILPKLVAGVPIDHIAFTRFAALGAEVFPVEAIGNGMKQLVLRAQGSPEQFGAFKPLDDIFQAGISLSQYYLPLVAEGRLFVKPWIQNVAGTRVTFTDGSQENFDAIIFGTGYELSLPFLSEDIRRTLAVDAEHIELFNFTFHPELPGMAFIGMQDQIGPYLPVLELQARWIAYVWAGLAKEPSQAELAEGIERYRLRRGLPQKQVMHNLAILFSRAAGIEPAIEEHPELARLLMFGPLTPASFRLAGPDRQPNAVELSLEAAATFGAMTSAEFRPEELAQLKVLEERRRERDGNSSQAAA